MTELKVVLSHPESTFTDSIREVTWVPYFLDTHCYQYFYPHRFQVLNRNTDNTIVIDRGGVVIIIIVVGLSLSDELILIKFNSNLGYSHIGGQITLG